MNKLKLIFLLIGTYGFSQEIISEEVTLNNDDIELPGTLSYPYLNDRSPLVIFIHGSGNIDRDGNQVSLVNANYIKVLADSLNGHGIAFYRFDKRTSNINNAKKLQDITFYDLVKDVKVVIDHFKSDKRFNGIHLIGHSQGSVVGMLLANQEGVKSYTSLAGPGEPIGTTLVKQITAQNKDLGQAAEFHVKELMENDTIQEVNPFLVSIFAPVNQRFLKDWIQLNPAEEIKNITKPILILNGDADAQVTVDDAELLFNAKSDSKLVIIKKMNHMLKTVGNFAENQRSYTDPNFPISNQLIGVLSDFIKTNE